MCQDCGVYKNYFEIPINEYNSSYSISKPIDDFSYMIDDVPEEIRRKINDIEKYMQDDQISKCKMLRGDNRKALLAVIYFSVRQEHGYVTTVKEVTKKFGLSIRKFNEGNRILMNNIKIYRSIVVKISQYKNCILTKLKLHCQPNEGSLLEMRLFFKIIDNDDFFNNSDPYNTCASLVLIIMKNQSNFKKGLYFKDIEKSELILKNNIGFRIQYLYDLVKYIIRKNGLVIYRMLQRCILDK